MLLAAASLGCASTRPASPGGPAAIPSGMLIAHALGGIDGIAYSNSVEAWEQSIARGYQWFEVDLSLTADGDLVCFHPHNEEYIDLDAPIRRVTTDEFLCHRYQRRFTLMTLADLLKRLATQPRTRLVTDTKWWTPEIASAFIRAVQTAPPGVARQIVPQIYRPRNISLLRHMERELGPFPAVIFTLYQMRISDDDVVTFAAREGIAAVSASTLRFNAELARRLHELGIKVLVHTVNDPAEIARLTSEGADGFYTDSYLPRDNR